MRKFKEKEGQMLLIKAQVPSQILAQPNTMQKSVLTLQECENKDLKSTAVLFPSDKNIQREHRPQMSKERKDVLVAWLYPAFAVLL